MAIFPSPLSGFLLFPFILTCVPYPSSTCRIDFSQTDTCPISPYPEWLGVVVKAEEYGSVRCRVLNGNKGSFPWSLYFLAYPSLLTLDILDFLPSWSYTVFALPSDETSDMPRTESSSAVSQGYFVLVLQSLGHNFPRLGPLGPNE